MIFNPKSEIRNPKSPAVLGIDLAGVETRPSGIAVLRGNDAATCHLFTDAEILAFARQTGPAVIGIDAPLSLPAGRRSIHERDEHHLRACDRALSRRGIRFFPVTLGPMRALTARGMRLKEALAALGYAAWEVYPGGAQDVLGIPRKQRGLEKLRDGLAALGIRDLHAGMSDHELDAVTGAYVMQRYLAGRASGWGDPDEGVIVMPE
jgi:predicted nuclease with RNAse H fold